MALIAICVAVPVAGPFPEAEAEAEAQPNAVAEAAADPKADPKANPFFLIGLGGLGYYGPAVYSYPIAYRRYTGINLTFTN